MLSTFNIWLVVVYFLLVIGIGWWVKRSETAQGFLIGERKVSLFQSVASIFAVLGGVVIVGQAALAFDVGFGAMWLWIGLALGMIILGLNVHKIKALSKAKKFLTISDYIFEKFGNRSGKLAAVILFLAFFALLTGQFVAAGSLFAPLLGISYPIAVLIMGLGTLGYLMLGGFSAVVKTDVLQFIIMIAIFVLIVLNIDTGVIGQSQFTLTSLDGMTTVSLILIGMFTVFAAPDIWQRIFAAKDAKTAKKASIISSILFVLFGIVLTIIGIAAKNNFPGIESSEALFYGLFELVPEALLGAGVIAMLAAIMSTIDTELFYLSSSIAKDFTDRTKEQTNEKLVKNIHKALIVIAIVSAIVAIFFSNIVTLLFALLSLTMAVSPLVICSLFFKVKRDAAFSSMALGLLSFILLLVIGQLTPETAVITLPAAFVGLILGQMFGKRSLPTGNISH
ncbi:MAG: Na+/proline symporter [Planctomycetota bacterium]|jgi:Na+/proline symporter